VNLNQVTVGVADIARATDFYARLGLKLIVRSPHYARFAVPDGGATFSIHLVAEPVASTTLVYFECDDLDLRFEALASAGVVFDQPPTDQTWLWREARLRDPDGNPLCLFRAGEARLNPPWRLPDTDGGSE
jgi:catechol 2,3-dioxygenase-like lactoylglutathione lyase family enzyme